MANQTALSALNAIHPILWQTRFRKLTLEDLRELRRLTHLLERMPVEVPNFNEAARTFSTMLHDSDEFETGTLAKMDQFLEYVELLQEMLKS